MDRRDVIKRMLYPKCKSAVEFKFDTLMANPLLSYITVQDIAQLNKIATSIKYSSKPKEKYKMIDQILVPRGFKKMASGTNRVVYRFLDDYRVVLKVAIDKVGLSDNGNEMRNQQLLKPFVTKCFEVSPCGTVGLFERVVPITSREEFINISEDVFDLINNIIGKYVLEDIGEKFYMNYGLREGFGPVLLDYPYVFELDGRKLKCNVQDPLDPKGYCGGIIDYDLGYNNLICTKCGKRYLATELKTNKKSDGGPKIIIEGEDIIMKCVLKRGDQIVSKLNSEEQVSTNVIPTRQQYDRLKGQVKRNQNYNGKNNNSNNGGKYKPGLNNKDDVSFQARLNGKRRSKDIDKIAREKEQRDLENTRKIPVTFDNNSSKKEEQPTGQRSVRTSFNLDTGKSKTEEVKTDKIKNPSLTIISEIYIENDYIYDENHKLLGYALGNGYVKKLERRVKELEKELNELKSVKHNSNIPEDENEEYDSDIDNLANAIGKTFIPDSDESEEEVKYESESCVTSLADKIKNAYVGNENYKTSGVTSPIDDHFHNADVVNESKEEDTNKPIPEVVIHNGDKTYKSTSVTASKSMIEEF